MKENRKESISCNIITFSLLLYSKNDEDIASKMDRTVPCNL
jgi:hypothetical protein